MKLLSRLLKTVIHVGTLSVIDADGTTHVFQGSPGPSAAFKITDKQTYRRLALNPELAVGEAVMDGTVQPVDCSLYDVLCLLMTNREHLGDSKWQAVVLGANKLARRLHQNNSMRRAQANVAHHYDLSNDLYRMFLDDDMQYSCAYFRSPDDTLEQAQLQKKLHIASKLHLKPGQRILDIGCGWGGMAMTLAELEDVEVVGVTLSAEQLKLARERVAERGLEGRVRIEAQDYRSVTGPFDRIVSVGMFEHVGVTHFDAFFGKVHELLKDDGVALLHSIGRRDPPGGTNAWLRKYIFPGGYAPALSETMASVERKGLWVTDIEIWRLHYAETLRNWRERFMANWDRAAALLDERFCRMWEFYLVACELNFRIEAGEVFQMQLTRDRSAVPQTRDYMAEVEARYLDRLTAPPSVRRHDAAD
ncbi:MAG: cyclopropane-fatty-acyl-phospholipid synthase family protein [Pseudomonadota bacterium]